MDYDASSSGSISKFASSLRAMPVKVVYTLNENTHQFFLARHMPIAVRVIKEPQRLQRQRARAAKLLKAQQAAASGTPERAKTSTPTRRSQTAAQTTKQAIQVDSPPEITVEDIEENIEYGFAPLRVCISAIWAASPDLAYDRTRDWSVYCLDPLEQPVRSPAQKAEGLAGLFSGVMIGMGLVSHVLAEDERVVTPVSVTGKIIDDQGTEALEVILQMKATMAPGAMPFPGWSHQAMVYGYPPQHPAFYQPPVQPAPKQRSQGNKRSKSANLTRGSTPATTEGTSPDFSAATPTPDIPTSEPASFTRSESVEPSSKPKKMHNSSLPQEPRPSRKEDKPKGKQKDKEKPKDPVAAASDVFASLMKKLNSVDGGSEPPPPDTDEGRLLDCMVAWLKTAAGAPLSQHISQQIGYSIPTPASSQNDGMTPANAIQLPPSPPATSEPSSSQGILSQISSLSQPSSQQTSSHLSSSQPSSSQSPARPSTPSNISQPKTERVVLGNKANASNKQPTNRVVSNGKGSSKSMSRSLSGTSSRVKANATKKRALDDDEERQGQDKSKRQKTSRSVSRNAIQVNTPRASASSSDADASNGVNLLRFPSTADILGIKFAPKRAYDALDAIGNGTSASTKTKVPEPATPKPNRRMSAGTESFTGLLPTSPFVGENGFEESLFSEAGSPVKNRTFSPFKPLGRRASDGDLDEIRPSSPCERRASLGRSKEPKTPPRMLGRSVTRSPSPPETKASTPQPHWAVDLPPSSPPPPSSPVGSTPVDEEGEEGLNDESQQTIDANAILNESPSKMFARYFSVDTHQQQGDCDLAASLLTGTSSTSFPSSDNELDPDFALSLGHGPSSSSGFSFDQFAWTEGTLTALGTSEPDLDVGAQSDLDFDVGELLGWIQNSSGGNGHSNTIGSIPSSDGGDTGEEDPLKALLGGCVL